MHRIYVALAHGRWQGARRGSRSSAGSGATRANRLRMAALAAGSSGAREGRTTIRRLDSTGTITAGSAALHTGRTHQIRVHMASLGHALVGMRLTAASPSWACSGQALHAHRLALLRPVTGEPLQFECALPPDLAQAVENAGLHYNLVISGRQAI